MKFLEQDLEKIIYETDNFNLYQRGLNISGKKLRQVELGNYGRCDLLTYERTYKPGILFCIWELKKDVVDVSSFLQAIRYAKGIKSYYSNRYPKTVLHFEINLVGYKIDTSNELIYLADLWIRDLGFGQESIINFYTYDFSFDGIYFNKHNRYRLKQEGF